MHKKTLRLSKLAEAKLYPGYLKASAIYRLNENPY